MFKEQSNSRESLPIQTLSLCVLPRFKRWATGWLREALKVKRVLKQESETRQMRSPHCSNGNKKLTTGFLMTILSCQWRISWLWSECYMPKSWIVLNWVKSSVSIHSLSHASLGWLLVH